MLACSGLNQDQSRPGSHKKSLDIGGSSSTPQIMHMCLKLWHTNLGREPGLITYWISYIERDCCLLITPSFHVCMRGTSGSWKRNSTTSPALSIAPKAFQPSGRAGGCGRQIAGTISQLGDDFALALSGAPLTAGFHPPTDGSCFGPI
jgi:hypothetical protein